jgi:predicted Zn finger-like uncharacterized protein
MTQITRCPNCETSFRLTEEQLRMANGSVRCGSCLTVFQADLHVESEVAEQMEKSTALQSELAGESEDFINSSEMEPVEWQDDQEWEQNEAHQEETQGSQDLRAQQESQDKYLTEAAKEPIPKEVLGGSLGVLKDTIQEPEQPLESQDMELEEAADTSDPELGGTREVIDDANCLGYEKSEHDELQEVNQRRSIVESYWESFGLYAVLLRSLHGPVQLPDELPESVEEAYLEDPDFIIGAFEPTPRLPLGWASCALFLIVVAVGQHLYFNFERYAADARYRGYAIEFCNYLGCSLPDYSDGALLTTGELSIRTNPEESGSLIVDAIVRNTALFGQRFPGVRLQFYDLRGTQVAARTFSAAEYLDGKLRGLRYIPAKTEVRFALEIVDPGDLAVGYDISVVVK